MKYFDGLRKWGQKGYYLWRLLGVMPSCLTHSAKNHCQKKRPRPSSKNHLMKLVCVWFLSFICLFWLEESRRQWLCLPSSLHCCLTKLVFSPKLKQVSFSVLGLQMCTCTLQVCAHTLQVCVCMLHTCNWTLAFCFSYLGMGNLNSDPQSCTSTLLIHPPPQPTWTLTKETRWFCYLYGAGTLPSIM